jgi:hypothetical protein
MVRTIPLVLEAVDLPDNLEENRNKLLGVCWWAGTSVHLGRIGHVGLVVWAV